MREDVHIARGQHVAIVEAVPVLVAAGERIAVGHIRPSVAVEGHIVPGRIVNLHPAVAATAHTVLGDEQVACGNLRLGASTAVGVHAEVTEVGRAAHEPLAVVGAAAQAATEELGDAVFAAQVLTRWVRIALVLRAAHEDHIVGGGSVAHAPVSDLIVVSLVVGEEVDDLEVGLRSANECKPGVAVWHVREGLVGLSQNGGVGVRVGQHVDIARLQDMAGVEAVPVLVSAGEWVAVGDIGPSVIVEEHWGTRRVVDLHVAVVRSSDHTVLGDEQVAGGGLDLSASTVVGVGTKAAVVVGAAHLPLAVGVAGSEAATDELGHTVLGAVVHAAREWIALELRQAHQDHVVSLRVAAHVPESERIVVSLPVGEEVDDLKAVRLALHNGEADVAVCDVLKGLVGLGQDGGIGLGVGDHVDLTRCEHGAFVEGVPVLVASRERVAVGDVRPSVVVEVDGVAGRVVDLHVAVVRSGLHTVLGDEQVARASTAV